MSSAMHRLLCSALLFFLLLLRVSAAAAAAAPLCHHPPYEVHVVSAAPLVVYLVGFVTPAERAHLLAVTAGSFARSAVAAADADTDAGTAGIHHGVRTSQSTTAPPGDPVARCLAERALRLQGVLGRGGGGGGHARVEPLQLVRYDAGAHYHYHTDWFPEPSVHAAPALGGNRASSVFAYVQADGSGGAGGAGRLRGGGTNFPMLALPMDADDDDDDDGDDDDSWCAFVDCDAPRADGVTFRPVAGNAVFWANLLPDGAGAGGRVGDPRTLHAGLPVVRGTKVGLNIWTREGALPAHVRGGEAGAEA